MTQKFPSNVSIQRTLKNLIQKETYIPMFIASPFTITKIWKQPKCSRNGWVNQDMVHTHSDQKR